MTSKIHFVDLAGSEKIKSAHTEGKRCVFIFRMRMIRLIEDE